MHRKKDFAIELLGFCVCMFGLFSIFGIAIAYIVKDANPTETECLERITF